jgi:protein kinase
MAIEKNTKALVAIKQIKEHFKEWDDVLKLREIKSLRKIKHASIVKLIEIIHSKQSVFLVFEYAQSNLYQQYLNNESHKMLEEKKIK